VRSDWRHPEIVNAVERALAEDIGSGDITTQLTVAAGRRARGKFFARDTMVLAGIELLPLIYELRGGPASPPRLRTRAARCSIHARRHPVCAGSKNWLPRPVASPTIAWGCSTPF